MRPETAEFLWDRRIAYLAPKLAPHPEDHLFNDLPIDADEPAMLWLPDFAEIHGREWENWPDWPKDRAGTVRNFARWLEMGLVSRDR